MRSCKIAGITHIVNVAGAQKFPSDFVYFRCYARDSADCNLLAKFNAMRQFIDDAKAPKAKQKGKHKLITPSPAASASVESSDAAPAPKSKKHQRAAAAAAAASKPSRNPYATAQQSGRVLIHCRGGISRSATLTIAYLMSINHPGCDSVDNALAFLRTKRPVARPNAGFMQQLRDFEQRLFLARALLSACAVLASDESVCELLLDYTCEPKAVYERDPRDDEED